MNLLQIVYLSSMTGDDETVLKDILEECGRNNAANGITGMLLYFDKQFMQVLEGPDTAVLATYQKVHLDSRHTRITELIQGPIDHRQFEGWSMGFRKLESQDAVDFPAHAAYFQFGFDANRIKGKPGAALGMLRHFSHLQR